MITILQVTDTHLSPRSDLFRANVERVRAAAAASPPDLVLATGDLSLDGADREEDLAFAAETCRGLPGRLLALPGNHDTGSDAWLMPHQTVNDLRLARWQRHFGPGCGVIDLPGWRVVGLNTEVLGSGHAEEAAQAGLAAEAASGAGTRRIALFLHRPPFLEHMDEPWNAWSVPPAGRAALAPLLDHPGLRLVASGHIHLHRAVRRGAASHVWAPALSFYCDPRDQPGLPGSRAPGALLHRLHADGVETVLLDAGPLAAVCIEDVRDRTYPRG